MVVKLGRFLGTNYQVNISEEADNQSVLLLGRSGSGKTVALWKIEENIAQSGASVLVLNYRKTHNMRPREGVIWLDVKKEGYPIPLFCRILRPDGTKEDSQDMEDAVMDVFLQTLALSIRQKAALRKAVHRVVEQPEKWRKGFYEIGQNLLKSDEEAALGVYDKFYSVFRGLPFSKETMEVFIPGKITVLDFSVFSLEVQIFLVELTLAILWRYFQIWGQYAAAPLFLVLDEFQELQMRKHSTLFQILREGRKFQLSVLLATQTLNTFERWQCAVIMQAGTRLYFRPDLKNIEKILAEDSVNEDFWCKIKKFQRGDCVAVGQFRIGNLDIQKSLLMTFREEELR